MGNTASNPARPPSSNVHGHDPRAGAAESASSSSSPASRSSATTPSAHGLYGSPKRTSSRREPRRLVIGSESKARPTVAESKPPLTSSRSSRAAAASSSAAGDSPASDARLVAQPQSPSERVASSRPVNCPPKQIPAPRNLDDPSYVDSSPSPPSAVLAPAAYFDTLHNSSSATDMSYHLTRPPRMPLPIEEEVHTPGSPIIPPLEPGDAVPVLEVGDGSDEYLQRHVSGISNDEVDEDDEYDIDRTKALGPITIEWEEGGNKVYVTGSIFQWNKKHRLQPVARRPGVMSAVIDVRPGTHHIRFIIDGDMKCSTRMPTTVDFGNNLVNYVEVPATEDTKKDAHTDTTATEVEPGDVTVTKSTEQVTRKGRLRKSPSARNYLNGIPQYLVDVDKPPGTLVFQLATAAVKKMPAPPSLPGFLAKPILNSVAPYKDDNSVLVMPNHTQLNHLGTSNFQDDMLAVSVTTRYKRKYVTTILYMPRDVDY